MSNPTELVNCYNRGCGKTFDPNNNPNNSCRFHPGEPYFHDAYKGWTCCNKRYTDFTEFLNTPGCSWAKHSNEKPPELLKPAKETNPEEVIKIEPIVVKRVERPPFNSPMVTLKPQLAPSLQQQKELVPMKVTENVQKEDSSVVAVGTTCKNGGCGKSYDGPQSDSQQCAFHPGSPVFHEGLKFWSCCQKRTSDFNAFLNQKGCKMGTHTWITENSDKEKMDCRWDWHQTGTLMVLAIYAKQYCPVRSTIQLSPVRVLIELVFPLENNSFKLDLELAGVVDVDLSQVSMYGTKVEVNMRKTEIRKWNKINIPQIAKPEPAKDSDETKVESLTPEIDAVDLSDL